MTKVVIFGAGGLSRTVAQYLKHDDRYTMVGFTVDRNYIEQPELDSLPVIAFEDLSDYISPQECKILVVLTLQRISNHMLDKQKCDEIRQKGYSLMTYVSKDAIVSPGVSIGENVIISPGVVVEPFTKIEDGVIVRSMAYIGHDVKLGEYSYIAPRVAMSGGTSIGAHAFIGINATLRGNIKVGREAVVGAGTTILKNVEDRAVIKAPQNILLPVDRDKIKIN
jgi:sugar O-acyltransferase (sialic acid O-acetyltransferase NeuD family)